MKKTILILTFLLSVWQSALAVKGTFTCIMLAGNPGWGVTFGELWRF